MKKIMALSSFLLMCSFFLHAQQKNWRIEAQYYTGSLIPHSTQISHLITDKPEGGLWSISRKAFDNEFWQNHYNHPDIGLSLHYQNNHNQTLGDLYGLFAHYDFYFLNRKLNLRIAQGVALSTNPYDDKDNFRNLAYGSTLMPSTYFQLTYRQNLWKNWQAFAGTFLIHHSNATIKTPNISTNTIALTAGLAYAFDQKNQQIMSQSLPNINKKMRYNVILRSGINESHIIGMGQKPFYHLALVADKRLNYTGSLQLGTELFLSNTVKEMIPFLANSYPESGFDEDTDWKRIGLFLGYEMHLDKLSLEGNFGYYIYDKYKENGSTYQRLGLRYYVYNNWFGSMSLKTHLAKAEAFEIGIGYKF